MNKWVDLEQGGNSCTAILNLTDAGYLLVSVANPNGEIGRNLVLIYSCRDGRVVTDKAEAIKATGEL